MRAFKERELDVLVATTVIEVGVDVPNATIMIVQEADRFGLAQLHQLRGRVGRGAEQSYCLLISRPKLELTEVAQARLEALVETTDGFELADRDWELRGEGQLLGTRQSGFGDLRFTRLRTDRALLERARDLAQELVDRARPVARRSRPDRRRRRPRQPGLTRHLSEGRVSYQVTCRERVVDMAGTTNSVGEIPANPDGQSATSCTRLRVVTATLV